MPRESLDIMLASLSKSTIKQYESSLNQWDSFCRQNKLDFFNPSYDTIIQFLTESFKAGATYGTLNAHRSAISLISKDKIGEHGLIRRFLKGIFRLKPAKPRYQVIWDVSIVLRYLSTLYPLDGLNLKQITLKTAMLLALCTAHRAQTLTSIKINNIVKTPDRIEIKVPEIIKTSGPGRFQPLIVVQTFESKPELCLVKTLLRYLQITEKIRGEVQQLFVTIKRPHKAINTQTFSHWVKSVLRMSEIDTSIFSAHSTRHASTSRAFSRGINLTTIRKTRLDGKLPGLCTVL